ncbi:MAG: hypothetical protein AB7P20_08325 [Rhizobiaceae bacterium]
MKDDNVTAFEPPKRLAEAIREVKNAIADRDDVIIEMREAERMRLELLANELAPIMAEVPDGTDLFDFAISSGLQPRFWIDAIAHVSMGRDKRTFRFLKDTRLGRVVLAESTDLKTVANAVTRYLAERIVERQRLMEGDVVEFRKQPTGNADMPQPSRALPTEKQSDAVRITDVGNLDEPSPAELPARQMPGRNSLKSFLGGLALAIAGAAIGLGVAAAFYWDKLGLAPLIKGGG